MTLSEELNWRGFVNQTTFDNLTVLDGQALKFYWGVDPSADSMQIGNLAAAMMVKCLMKHGHQAVLLVGGATGLIGDPDGKSEERNLKSREEIEGNKRRIVEQYKKIFQGLEFELVDNYDWFKDMNYLEFLREVGKHVPMRQMLARDFIQSRLGEDGTGISYAEFSYVLIQAYDFLHLYKDKGVILQVCGSDQWGNSIAGVELIRRMAGGEAHVYSVPLIVNKATGKKFGKSEDGTIWLEADKTSVYKFYQFWLNADDDGVSEYLKVFTEIDKDAIAQIMTEFEQDRGARGAQKRLAYEVTKLVHGQDQADKQVRIAEAIAAQNLERLDDAELATLREELPTAKAGAGTDLIEILSQVKLVQSNSEARQLLSAGAIYINGQKVLGEKLESSHFQNGRLIIRRGKAFKDSAIVELEG